MMPPGSLTALEKTIIAQAVHQGSSTALAKVAGVLNAHPLIEQRQGKPPRSWIELDVKVSYLELLETHLSARTREALLDREHLDAFSLEDFPFLSKGCDASLEVVTACFREFYLEIDTILHNDAADFEAAAKQLKKIINDESSSEEEKEDDNDDEESSVGEPTDEDETPTGDPGAIYRPAEMDDSTSASEDDD